MHWISTLLKKHLYVYTKNAINAIKDKNKEINDVKKNLHNVSKNLVEILEEKSKTKEDIIKERDELSEFWQKWK